MLVHIGPVISEEMIKLLNSLDLFPGRLKNIHHLKKIDGYFHKSVIPYIGDKKLAVIPT